MESINFEILRKDRPELASLGGFAEGYAHTDPASALVKLRTYGEQLAKAIYWELRLPKPQTDEFAKRLTNPAFKNAVPKVICDKLHAIRIEGNKAAHGKTAKTKTALWLLQEAFESGAWFAVRCLDKKPADVAPFQQVAALADDTKKQKEETEAALEKVAEQEAALEALIAELNKAKADYEALEQEASKMALAGKKVADELHMDEETTRHRLIDVALADAGWDIGLNGANTQEVTQEEKVDHQPTETGIGYIDYVLWDDNGKPLAVVEAKKTSVDAEKGKAQAKYYADGLEKEYGQRPVIFYTNGYDINIWDDAQDYPPRELFGFYSKDSLQYLVNFQRSTAKPLNTIAINKDISGRLYQMETIKRVCERFTGKHRKSLIVQATGTGKTRVAIGLSDLLIRANWVKRILFVCDRRALRKQAKNAYGDFLKEPLTIVSRKTAKDRNQRIYLATYPSMMDIFQTFDVGFFDLIIADESHRSVYNVYGDLFRYFDCLQVGLTATPVEFIARNTYGLFGCKNQDPTAFYSLERAIDEKYLVPYEVHTHTTAFLREGIKYDQLTDKQKKQIEEDGIAPEELEHDAKSIDQQIFNKDTNRAILRNLMENGIKDPTGQHPGKTIVFARNHDHAILMQKMFDEMYPQYGGKFCTVIDNYDPRAEQLIDDFKDSANPLTVALSVDMLDTGIDVPEIVNLVFAKPVKSKVKFWQMIGRGTRLCPDLFGAGQDKSIFRIFDHWANFEYFEQPRPEAEPSQSKPLMQRVFESRIDLADTALHESETECFKVAVELLSGDVASLPKETISVKEKWREIQTISQDGVIEGFGAATVQSLRTDIAPLMQWVNVRGHADAYAFDLLIADMQIALLRKSNKFDDLQGDLLNQVSRLRMNLNPVKEKAEIIKMVKEPSFWASVTVSDLEKVRGELRSIMQYKDGKGIEPPKPRIYDIEEDEDAIKTGQRSTNIKSIDLAVYRVRVEEVLTELFDNNSTLKKIRAGETVTEDDLNALVSLVLTQHPDLDLTLLNDFYPDLAGHLDVIIREIVGMDADTVKDRFSLFVQKHPTLTARQTQFIRLLQNHIAGHGAIEIDGLYEAPFTSLDPNGVDGLFPNEAQITELLNIVRSFEPDLSANKTEGTPK